MNCDRALNENIIERYLTGTLEPDLKEAWEEHYFVCPECTRRLETWQAVEDAIRESAPAIREQTERDRIKPRRRWILAGGIAAAILLALAIRIPMRTGPASVPHRPAALTAQLDPPVYTEPVTRGVESQAETAFRRAMQFYQSRDWMDAIEGLRASLALDPHSESAHFFLGASYLLAGNAPAGVPGLERVAAGTSPFAEEARFVLAHGYLMEGRQRDAESTLRQIVEAKGDFASRAAGKLREIGESR